MNNIRVEHNPDAGRLAELGVLGVTGWPIWPCDASEFPRTYDSRETCCLLEGEVFVTPAGGTPVAVKAGDLVEFPAGMSCRRQVSRAVRKHYRFE